MKIIEKIQKLLEEDNTWFSFEYFPPKTQEGVANLYRRMESMGTYGPAFADVTWGAGGSTSDLTLEICATSQKYLGLETMMHLTCTNMPLEKLRQALVTAKETGIQNILALRGDPPRGEEWKKVEGGFSYAVDLVRYIRENFGDHFGICVGGYPEGHIDSTDHEEDLKHLKEKIDAGADFIITQLFFDTSIFLDFIKKCRAIGITCPIIPGIMPIHTYAGFKRMASLCKTFVPKALNDDLEAIKDNDEEVKAYGVKYAIEMCRTLLHAGIKGFHFYTLNLEKSVTQIVEGLGFLEGVARPMPWRRRSSSGCNKEEVRPVFWNHRHQSYIKRTETWDDFPNGRWGDSRSPAFGELTDFHLGVSSAIAASEKKTNVWGSELKGVEDVKAVFVAYCERKINELPWNDLPLNTDSDPIREWLLQLNRNAYLTINSQPRVNCAPSTDPIHGWGGANGWVYQKAYVEFFVDDAKLKLLLEEIKKEKYSLLSYHAVNSKGDQEFTNSRSTNALTWGVFPDAEVKQPTVVDRESFLVWKDEAFSLWNVWARQYPEGSSSREVITGIQSQWFLVNIVDNDFVGASQGITKLFQALIAAAALAAPPSPPTSSS